MKQIAIITTKQNYVWKSMQEVIPAIENCWEATVETSRIINVDVEPLRDHITFLMSCEAFVVIAFNETIARFIISIRETLGLKAPLILHLYGHATIAMWPESRFGVLQYLTEGDAFIGTCDGDLTCMSHTFYNAKSFNIPYPYYPLSLPDQALADKRVFAYVGRISDQKNINLLLSAYSEFLKISSLTIPLYLYGKEDFLGSPNMGIPSTNYLEELKAMVGDLYLDKNVHFMGHKSREEIYYALGRQHIFVSPSTHSDENFGMAAMRSLALGGKAVLSSWGGHKEFKKQMPNQVWLSRVHFENCRPVIDPIEFAQLMLEALQSNSEVSPDFEYFLPTTIIPQFKIILSKLHFSNKKLELTTIAKVAHRQQKDFEHEGNIQKVFTDYCDPIAQTYLNSYS
jgi:glycosyltransferase involved in cell wall biosynthesis